MSTYLFILGKDRELSLAELSSRYPDAKFTTAGSDFALIETNQKIDQDEFNNLGGVVKAGEVLAETYKNSLSDELTSQLIAGHSKGKLNYGVSIYGMSEKNLRMILLDIKKRMKKEGISSRFANQNFKNISSAQHKGLKNGTEILVAKDDSRFIIAKVIAVQDIDAYSERDYKKPFRDMKVGMLPPKLAQIMINLAGDANKIWDPFCGGGVLIMEGLLMGHEMMGSDIDAKTLEGAKKNVSWLKKEADLFVHDATKVLSGKKFDAIVCEGYLGPPQTRIRSAEELSPLVAELDKLYSDFFDSVEKSGFKGPIVIALPFFKTGKGELDLSVIKKIDPSLKPLRYARSDQIVGRAIYHLTFNI